MDKKEIVQKKPILIILAGLPGTGKTTLARLLAKELSLVYLRVDCIEAPFCAAHMDVGAKGYQALIHVARENLRLEHGVIIDTVNPLHITRSMFLALAKEEHAKLIQFELKVKDVSLHQKRVEERKADIPGLDVPTWQDVRKREYDEWNEKIDGHATVVWMDNGELAFQKCLNVIHEFEK